jgi:hypothetical protein
MLAGMRIALWCLAAGLLLGTGARADDFGSKGGRAPANVDEIADILRQDPYDLELLISFGTSKGGSAGHLALALRDATPCDDFVYSANFYADRSPEHEKDFYTGDLMIRIPKMEYLYGTRSTLDDKASFGLDYGEIYKRSVVGVRVRGVPAGEKLALAGFFSRLNDDFHRRARNTEYHDGEVRYDYLRMNCAKTIGSAFRYGAGYKDLKIASTKVLPGWTRVVAALNANIPTEMAMKLVAAWHARGYGMDVVLYKKYEGSTYVDPHEDDKLAFKDLPNRFPSVLSRDFSNEQGHYEDYDNLYAMYLLYNLGRYSVRVNDETRRLEIEKAKGAMDYAQAARLAARDAKLDSKNFQRHARAGPRGTPIEGHPDNTHLYNFPAEGGKAVPR